MPGSFHPFLRAIYTGAASTHPAINRPPKARPGAALLVQLTGWEENGVTKADRYIPYVATSLGPTLTSSSRNIEPGETYAVPDHHSRNTMVIQPQTRLREDDLSSVITQLLLYSLDGPARTTVDDSELRKDEAMTVWHYHFDAWPDHGVPEGEAVNALRRLILEIARRREELGDCEVWVHWCVDSRFDSRFALCVRTGLIRTSLARPASVEQELSSRYPPSLVLHP